MSRIIFKIGRSIQLETNPAFKEWLVKQVQLFRDAKDRNNIELAAPDPMIHSEMMEILEVAGSHELLENQNYFNAHLIRGLIESLVIEENRLQKRYSPEELVSCFMDKFKRAAIGSQVIQDADYLGTYAPRGIGHLHS